jgi:TonB-linked SusC/RagA family outer membrane protein
MKRGSLLIVLALVAIPIARAVAQERFELPREIALGGPRFFRSTAVDATPVDPRSIAALQRRVTLTARETTLGEALRAITRQTSVRFHLSRDIVPVKQPVRIEATGLSLAAALTELLLGTPLDVAVVGSAELALVPRRDSTAAGAVTGRVTDQQSGAPLLGAEVMLEGTRWRATADPNGRYRISDVPAGSYTIAARRIGYARKTQPIQVTDGAEASADFALEPTALSLDAIVVTGTPGETERRALGNAITQLDADQVRELVPASDAIQMINGRAPGVVVQPPTGVVGGGARIRIRGASSLTLFNSEPLLYVDGVRVDNRSTGGPANQGLGSSAGVASRLADFSPEMIESIEIIKGPAAAALYGTEATGGVIQVITKRGRSGKTEVAATITQGANWFEDAEDRWPTLYAINPANGQIIEANLAKLEKARGTPMFRTGYLGRYAVNVGGGTERLRYFAGVDFDKQEGIEPTNSLRQFRGRLNLDAEFGNKLSIGANLGLVTSALELPMEHGGGGIWSSEYGGNPLTVSGPTRGFSLAPPEVWNQVTENHGGLNRITSSIKAEQRLTSWLSHRLALGLDYVNEDNYTLIRNTASDPYLSQFNLGGGGGTAGTKWARRNQTVTSTVDYGITGTTTLGKNLVSNTSAGFQYFRSYSAFTSAEGRGFPDFSVSSISAAATTFSSDDFLENVTVGAYVQQQLGWRNRLFFTGALRADDNSAFGQNFDAVVYPKVSASWVVSEEPFWPFRFVDALKLRAAYGHSGQQPAAFSAIRTYTAVGGETGIGFRPGASGNPDLGPERGKELEVGFEAGLFGGRIGTDFTFYHKTTHDAILAIPTVPSEGFMGTRLINAGVIRNKGVEAVVRVQVIDGRKFGWEVTGNISHNDNEILELADGLNEIRAFDTRLMHRVGYPAFGQYARKVVSADRGPNGTVLNVLCDGGPENNHTPMACAQAPAVFIGGAIPKLEGSVGTTISLFNRLRLYGLVDFKGGYALFDNSELLRCFFGRCRERVYPEEFDPIRIATTQNQGGGFDWVVKTLHFARLRELSAAVSLPPKWAELLGARRADFRLSGRNLKLWTDWTGLDPESFATPNLLTIVRATTPQLSQFTATINLVF